MSQQLDKRLHAYREDLADSQLKGKVEAARFVDGEPARIRTSFADIHKQPQAGTALEAQIIYGHDVVVFERKDGWAWVQCTGNRYVGYIKEDALAPMGDEPTHMVLAPRTFLYSQSDLKSPRCDCLSIGSRLTVVDHQTTRGTNYHILKSGESIIARHTIEIGQWKSDPVAVAESLLGTPYLWGGDTGLGIDCSGLVGLSHLLCGKLLLRDSDMLGESFGEAIEFNLQGLQRGDLIFWKGHVGMMVDPDTLLHANGHTMDVALEKLTDAVERIGYLYGQPTQVRRI